MKEAITEWRTIHKEKLNNIGMVYSLEYIDIPKVFSSHITQIVVALM
jgi:hypothetical protein